MRAASPAPERFGAQGAAALVAAVILAISCGRAEVARSSNVPGLPDLPAAWPRTLQLGMSDAPGGAAALRTSASFGFRYQYLAGGVNTGNGWATWNPGGGFVTAYVDESLASGFVPVFTYYMLRQSSPGNARSETEAVAANLGDTTTMRSYYVDLSLFFRRAGAFKDKTVVLHVEPDLWGYVQQRAQADDAATVPAKVGSTGVPELAGLPDDASGFARAIVALRDRYAPNVILGHHLSVWGTGDDLLYSKPSDATVDALARRAASFFRSLRADFDVAFGEFSDRDAAFKQFQYGDGGASWWRADDFARHVRFIARFVEHSRKRLVLWQIPLGNTKMRAMNNTWDHYQDNHVEWLLDDASRTHLTDYANAGVIALLFGRGADGGTCACDAAGDGATDPPAINGNVVSSTSADDDGGYFRQKAREYYSRGPLPLPSASRSLP